MRNHDMDQRSGLCAEMGIMMRKHKWRRRLIILIMLIVLGVIILTPDERKRRRESEEQQGEETIVGWMIDKVAAGEVELSDEDSIRRALEEAETELAVSLTEDNQDKVVSFLQTLGSIEVETEGFIDEAREKYRKYSAGFVEEANEVINEAVEDAVASTARNFFDSIRQAVGDFFKSLLPG